MVNKDLRHGQALAMQWVLFAIQKMDADIKTGGEITDTLLGEHSLSVGGTNGLATLEVGIQHTRNILMPFAIELALKAVIEREDLVGRKKRQGHKLSDLYSAISDTNRNKIKNEFRKLISPQTIDIEDLLVEYSNDFVEWRYLDKPETLAPSRPTDMQLALCSILTVYNDYMDN